MSAECSMQLCVACCHSATTFQSAKQQLLLQLQTLNLGDNNFVGTLPETWGNLTKVSLVIELKDNACPCTSCSAPYCLHGMPPDDKVLRVLWSF